MIETRPINIAHHSPVAPIGSRVGLNIAALFVHDEGRHGAMIDYMGQHFLVKRSDVLAVIDKQQQLIHVQTPGTVLSHDGCVGYTVCVEEAEIRVHEQNIIGIIQESEVQ